MEMIIMTGTPSKRQQMYYAEPIYRPPSEAYSLLIQASVGCSAAAAGRCYFCTSCVFDKAIAEKRFRIRPLDDILQDIQIAKAEYGKGVTKIFLLDSNAMVIRTPQLLRIVEACYKAFPRLKQVSCYACCGDILRKSDTELRRLRQAGLNLVFLGLESGDQQVLDLMNKGATVQDQIDAVVKAGQAGIRTSVTIIIGLGGKKMTERHAINTGKAVSAMNPTYLSALTLMVVPRSPLDDMIRRGEFEMVTDPGDILHELGLIIRHIDVPGPVIFRTNHASNYLPLKGTLPQDKAALSELVHAALRNPAMLRAESRRGL
jgi:radical SAM superfamily enzyme YgiQ (UPF0313 family)